MCNFSSYSSERLEIAGVPVSRLAKEFGGTPLYVYDADMIARRCAQLTENFQVVRYAQKACSNIALLKFVRERGLVVDAVSAAEIKRALTAGYQPQEIAYTCDIFDEDALELVLGDANGCVVNVGSIDMIRQFGERLGAQARGRELTIRINPGFGHGHSRKTNTGGDLSKHGIWFEQLSECLGEANRYGMTITGLHMHIGSGSDFAHLAQVCDAMERIALKAGSEIRTISCGGGLPVPYRGGEEYVNLARYSALWAGVVERLEKAFGHDVDFEIEPGRYVVAESGYLISQIRAIKKQGDNRFYLVDAGFAHLVRPMAYGSYHPISIAYNPEVEGEVSGTRQVVVGGPLCESGDVFTQEEGGFVVTRELPAARVGDYLVLEVAGAYGASMASNYNSKYYAPEVLVENGAPRLIRKKQSFESLIANEIF